MSNAILSKTCLMCNIVFYKPKTTAIEKWLKRECCSRRCAALHRPQPDSTPISYLEAAMVKMLIRGASVKRIAEKLNITDALIIRTRIRMGAINDITPT